MLTTDLALRFDPDVREDLAPVPRAPRRVRAGLRQGLVQAAAPRHGAGRALPRPVGPRAAAVAGPGAAGRPRARLRRRRRRPQGGRARQRPHRAAARPHRVGVGGQLPGHRQARRGQRRPHPPGAAARLGVQRRRRAVDACSRALEQVKADFDGRGGARVSLADLIVLGGSAAVEKAARDAGHDVTVPFHPGRTDASQEQTDVDSFKVLQPRADGFRSYLHPGEKLSPEMLLLDRANLLNLTAPEMTVLVGGMRAIGANVGDSDLGVLTERRGQLTTTSSAPCSPRARSGRCRRRRRTSTRAPTRPPGQVRWTATAVDLVFGSHAQLRALSEVYAERRRAGQVRARLRRGLGQGHGARPLRPPPLRHPLDRRGPATR